MEKYTPVNNIFLLFIRDRLHNRKDLCWKSTSAANSLFKVISNSREGFWDRAPAEVEMQNAVSNISETWKVQVIIMYCHFHKRWDLYESFQWRKVCRSHNIYTLFKFLHGGAISFPGALWGEWEMSSHLVCLCTCVPMHVLSAWWGVKCFTFPTINLYWIS